MMGTLSTWFNFKGTIAESGGELPEIFPFPFLLNAFIEIDVTNIYSKILTDVAERSHGLSEEQAALLWDNCLKSEKGDGIISMLAKAMFWKKDLFLVYDKPIKIVREATPVERGMIEKDYAKKAESSVGIYISFKQYTRTDMVKLYSGLEHSTIASLYKTMNLSKAIQFKMNEMRSGTGLNDSADVIAQAKQVAQSLSIGRDVLLDGKDMIETSKPELEATKQAIAFLDSKRSFYLGMPSSYINGEQTGGIGSTGEADAKAVERGLRAYYFSILKPVLEKLFGVTLKFKSQDFRQITQALEAMKVFQLTDESLVSHEQKKIIIESLLDIDADDNDTEEEATPAAPVPPVVSAVAVTRE